MGYRILGKLKTAPLEARFGPLQTDELILMEEREAHICHRHPEDFDLFASYGPSAALDPDLILADAKNEGTVFMIRRLPETNLNVVVRVALERDTEGFKNSIMTFYRIRDRNLEKLMKRNEILYRRE